MYGKITISPVYSLKWQNGAYEYMSVHGLLTHGCLQITLFHLLPHLLNQYYNSQPKTHGNNYILAYTRLLISLVQRQENYDLAKTRIFIGLKSIHMRPGYSYMFLLQRKGDVIN